MDSINIGARVRQLRLRNGLTLNELSSRCELTKGFLSQVENNMTSPSIATLNDILEALGTTPAEFFKTPGTSGTVFGTEDFFEDVKDEYVLRWIVPDAQKRQMEPLLIELNEGGKSFVMEPHEGEEFGYVLQGRIKIIFKNKAEVVERGETFYVDGNVEYHLLNIAKSKSKILWVSTPPSF